MLGMLGMTEAKASHPRSLQHDHARVPAAGLDLCSALPVERNVALHELNHLGIKVIGHDAAHAINLSAGRIASQDQRAR